MKNLFLIIALISTSFTSIFAQDIIELKSGDKLEVNITKIGKENIEFRPYGKSKEEAVIVVDKFLVKSYTFEYATSTTSIIADKLTNIEVKDLYDNRRFIAIKTQPLQALVGNFKLNYEQSIAYNQSFELEVGLKTRPSLDLFSETYYAPQFNTTARYKFFYRPSSMKLSDTGKNPLNGLYLAPGFTVGNSTGNDNNYYYNYKVRANNIYAGGFVDLGYQFIINKAIVDSFIGVGGSLNSVNTEYSFNNSHTSLGVASIRAGFRMGLNFAR